MTGRYKAYPEYKSTDEVWLGDVPAHWRDLKINRLTLVKRGASPRPIDDPKYFDEAGEYVWVRIADVTASDTYLENTTQRLSSLGASLSVKLEPNELFISIAGTVGKPCINKIKACIHDGFVYFPDYTENTKFLFYIFAAGEAYKGLGKFGTQLNLNTETVGGIKIGIPCIEEQQKIATFLDHETAKIDILIAKQEKLIELLKEKRQAVISHAVTKGLNPDAPMKDSGVEWLGEVPEHWIVCCLKHIKGKEKGSFVDGPFGSNLKSEHFVDDGDVYVIESNFATTGILDKSKLKTISNAHFSTISRSETKKGAIIIAKIGARYGMNSVMPVLDKKAVVSGNSLSLTVDSQRMNVDYCHHLLTHLKQEEAMDDGVNVTAQPALSLGNLNNLPFLVLPIDEQNKIVAFLEDKKIYFTSLISNSEKMILLSKERKTALISAAVTGKIDVRNWIKG